MLRRSPYDREILRLAVPALGALAAEPLYVLVDTAIVGHLGTTQLAALAIAATVMTTAFTVFNFLTYGTTAQVARLHGAGRERDAAHLGAQAQWLALLLGAVLVVAIAGLAVPVVRLMGGEGDVADGAVTYLRIAALGAPAFMLASAGQGYLRGMGDLRTPLIILVAAHAVNVVLELLFVYGFDWGLAGSAWGTVIAQLGMGAAFVAVQLRAGWQRPVLAAHAQPDADRGGDRRADLGAARLVPGRLGRAGPGRRGVARRAPDRLPAVRLPRARARRRGDRRAGHGRADARRRRRGRRARRGGAHDRLVGLCSAPRSAPSCTRSAT